MAERDQALAPLCGLVLAGGHSERLGSDKAAVVVAGGTLLERAVALLEQLVVEVRVAIRPEQATDALRSRFATVRDAQSGIGPAAGILAAHRCRSDAAWLVLACDMPRVTSAMLQALIAARRSAPAGVAYRAPDGTPEPLCAIYEPATLARLRRQVEAGGSTSPRDCLVDAGCLLLDAPGPQALASINTPHDLASLR